MRIVIISGQYPSANNIYTDVFVHTRAVAYKSRGHDVHVITYASKEQNEYCYEGIPVYNEPNASAVYNSIRRLKPDTVFIHFFHPQMLEWIERTNIPITLWVHGHEAMNWYRRYWNFTAAEFIRYFPGNVIATIKRKRTWKELALLSKRTSGRIHFVFVSEWIKRVAQADNGILLPFCSVISNPINSERFAWTDKKENFAANILSIKSFATRMYANDITVKTILKLSKHSIFSSLNFSLYGDGKHWDCLQPLKKLQNVHLNRTFIEQKEISSIHLQHGIWLGPTRMDTQGVSMCEAMSSGLVPVTSKVAAIPEFVRDGIDGILTDNSPKQLAEAVIFLNENPSIFKKMSLNASLQMKEKCSVEGVISKELKLATR